jgi:hypothetical protein
MSYTITRTDGVTITIEDGTTDTTSTSLALMGNAGNYGDNLVTNFVHLLENFANSAAPAHAIKGQLWFDTSANVMKYAPQDAPANANAWTTLSSVGDNSSFGNITATGNITGNNLAITNNGSVATLTTTTFTATTGNIQTLTSNSATLANLTTANITTGSITTQGNLIGLWNLNTGGVATANALTTPQGIKVGTIYTDNYKYANGATFNPGTTYSDANVATYLTAGTPNVRVTSTLTSITLNAGSNTTAGTITGNWTLSTGSRFNSTYADLAENFIADQDYPQGTVVRIGGNNEITLLDEELSTEVFGVVSTTAGYIMNSGDIMTPETPEGEEPTSFKVAIAVAGRVPVLVEGQTIKGQRLVSNGNGTARAGTVSEVSAFNVLGRALGDKTSEEVGLVECFVTIN